VRRALESLPWVRKASVDFEHKQATATVVSEDYDEASLLKALKDAGYGGKVVKPVVKPAVKPAKKDKPMAKAPKGELVAFRVSGMKKTKSGAT
jgi:copper chaperone CopZ